MSKTEPMRAYSRLSRSCPIVLPMLMIFAGSLRAAEPPRAGDNWPTLHHDAMRTGRTADSPSAPFDYIWHREYWDELIAPEAEPIVADGLVFLGTYKGILRGLDAQTGAEVWKSDLGGPIRHSPAYDSGRIFSATMGGIVVAVDARSGREIWRFSATHRGGFAASPVVDHGVVYIGDRAGDFHAIKAATGNENWSVALGGPILESAAIRDGKVAIAAEDLVPHLFDADTGREIWRGQQMNGATLRGYYPIFWNNLVVWRTEANAIDAYQNDILSATDEGKLWRETRDKYRWTKQADDIIKTIPGKFTTAKYEQEQRYIQQRMADGKHPRSFYALNVTDGTEPQVYAVGYHSSENGYSVPASSPVDAEGRLYVFTKSVFSEWQYPIRAFDAVSILETGNELPALIRDIDRTHGSFPATCDESNNLVLAGDKLFDTHDHVLAYMDLSTRRIFNAYSSHSPELWGGVAKCIASDKVETEKPGVWHVRDTESSLHFATQWNGPAQGSVAICGNKIWWITGSTIVCLKGTVGQ